MSFVLFEILIWGEILGLDLGFSMICISILIFEGQ